MYFGSHEMENEIIAPADGNNHKTEVQQGSAVQTDDILVVIGYGGFVCPLPSTQW